jgi:hypothetical protein
VAQERIEYLFAAQVQGQREMQQLVASVDKLRQEVEALKTANGGLAASTETVIRNGKRYNTLADAQAKELRRQRQGTQQLGMQFNDLATSISTGASPIQAFNQQLGQIGFALSEMGGKAGAFGAFLAGPWGALITLGTMALTPLIMSFFETGEASKKLTDALKADRAATVNLLEAKAQLDEALGRNTKNAEMAKRAAVDSALANLEAAATDVKASQIRVKAALLERSSIENLRGVSPGFSLGAKIADLFGFGDVKKATKDADELTTVLKETTASVYEARANLAKFLAGDKEKPRKEPKTSEIDKVRQAQEKIIAEFEAGKLTYAEFETQLTAVTDAYKEARNPAEEFLSKFKEADQAAKKFDDAAVNLANKSLPDWLIALRSINAEYKFLADNNRETTKRMSDLGQMATATAAGPLEAMLEKYEKMNAGLSPVQEDMAALAHIMNILSEEGSAAGVNLEYIAMLYKRIREEMDKAEVTKKNAEIKSSFESIGNAVSDAFKGMLTGAASFKDGMKSIINSVIDELWKLYVVKQIVGFFTDTVMPAIGIKLPKFANGTMNAPGGLALVGERGPELVNLPKGSQVIPNHKMKGGIGGGINITVDARGSSDPAAVRAQVQQGILEAAPAIIAAAEARTTRGLRRPRLAGVMQ